MHVCVLFFFFQAEDGIRDLVRSRGLGDVYKRQETRLMRTVMKLRERLAARRPSREGGLGPEHDLGAVSYTHLTLPTSDLV